MKKIRYISIATFCLAALLLLASCSGSISPIDSSKEDMQVVGTLAGRDVYYEELRYLVMRTKADLEVKYGEGIWDSEESASKYAEELSALVYENIISDYYAVYAMANDYYVGGGEVMITESAIKDAVQAGVDATAEECVEIYGGSLKKAYKKGLAETFMTDRLFRFYLATEECATELFYILANDLEVIGGDEKYYRDYLESDDFIRTNHVFLKVNDTSSKTEWQEKRELADEVRKRIVDAGENAYYELITCIGKYSASLTNTTLHGNYFTYLTSDCGDEYEDAAFDLDINEVSEVVETENGFYVIMRLPTEADYIEANYDSFVDDILGSEFNREIKKYAKKLEFKLNDYGKSLDLTKIK